MGPMAENLTTTRVCVGSLILPLGGAMQAGCQMCKAAEIGVLNPDPVTDDGRLVRMNPVYGGNYNTQRNPQSGGCASPGRCSNQYPLVTTSAIFAAVLMKLLSISTLNHINWFRRTPVHSNSCVGCHHTLQDSAHCASLLSPHFSLSCTSRESHSPDCVVLT